LTRSAIRSESRSTAAITFSSSLDDDHARHGPAELATGLLTGVRGGLLHVAEDGHVTLKLGIVEILVGLRVVELVDGRGLTVERLVHALGHVRRDRREQPGRLVEGGRERRVGAALGGGVGLLPHAVADRLHVEARHVLRNELDHGVDGVADAVVGPRLRHLRLDGLEPGEHPLVDEFEFAVIEVGLGGVAVEIHIL